MDRQGHSAESSLALVSGWRLGQRSVDVPEGRLCVDFALAAPVPLTQSHGRAAAGAVWNPGLVM